MVKNWVQRHYLSHNDFYLCIHRSKGPEVLCIFLLHNTCMYHGMFDALYQISPSEYDNITLYQISHSEFDQILLLHVAIQHQHNIVYMKTRGKVNIISDMYFTHNRHPIPHPSPLMVNYGMSLASIVMKIDCVTKRPHNIVITGLVGVNLLWSNDVIRQHKFRSTLALKVMALPDGTKQFSEPMLIWDYWHPFQCNLTEDAQSMQTKNIM